jgi:threonine/homoserine/homoserine lactone efflux protein
VASEPAFVAVKLAGAAYLVFLGAQALLRAFSRRRSAAADTPAAGRKTSWAGFRQGLISNLGNPKMAVFFTSLLPQFSGGNTSFAALLFLGFIFCLMTLVWLTGYAVVVAKAGDFLGRPRVRRTIDAVTGAIFVAFGFRLATERR